MWSVLWPLQILEEDVVSNPSEISQHMLLELSMFSWVGRDVTSIKLVPGNFAVLSALYDRAKVIWKGPNKMEG